MSVIRFLVDNQERMRITVDDSRRVASFEACGRTFHIRFERALGQFSESWPEIARAGNEFLLRTGAAPAWNAQESQRVTWHLENEQIPPLLRIHPPSAKTRKH